MVIVGARAARRLRERREPAARARRRAPARDRRAPRARRRARRGSSDSCSPRACCSRSSARCSACSFARWGSRLLVSPARRARRTRSALDLVDRRPRARDSRSASRSLTGAALRPRAGVAGDARRSAGGDEGEGTRRRRGRRAASRSARRSSSARSRSRSCSSPAPGCCWAASARSRRSIRASGATACCSSSSNSATRGYAARARARSRYREMLDRLRALPGVRAASASLLTPVSGSGWNEDHRSTATRRRGADDMSCVQRGERRLLRDPRHPAPRRARLRRPRGRRRAPGRDRERGGGAEVLRRRQPARPQSSCRMEQGRTCRRRWRWSAWSPTRSTGRCARGRGDRLSADSRQGPLSAGLSLELRTAGPLAPLDSRRAAVASPRRRAPLLRAAHPRRRRWTNRSPASACSPPSPASSAPSPCCSPVSGSTARWLTGVARRRNEIAIRIALGAVRARGAAQRARRGGNAGGVGAALGVLLALAATRWVALLPLRPHPRRPADPRGPPRAILAAVAFAAGALPAWRAARLDPVVLLREE